MKKTAALIILGLLIVSTISLAFVNSVSALTIDSVVVADSIQPGKTTKILIGLDNDGNNNINDVSVILDLTNVPFAPFNSASEYGIEEIKEDKTEFAEFNVIALNNAQAGIYKIPVTIRYILDDKEYTKNSLISIVVESQPEIGVSVDDSLLLKGKDNEFFIEITNKGLSDAQFVEIVIGSGQYDLLGPNKYYIGNIDSNDFDSVSVNTYFKDNVGNSVNMPIKVIYRDSLNNKYEETFNINLRVYDERSAVNLGLIERNDTLKYIFGLAILAVLYFIYIRLKKKARQNRQSQI